jgi:dephospho-CoA kinase
MNGPVFNTLENAQDVNKIAEIFSRGKDEYELKPRPLFVVLVGSPGVGKTSKAREFLKKELGVDYNDFYNIALDSVVERVKPYRTTTKHLYNTLKSKKAPGEKLTNENFATLSEVYLPTIMTTQSNFKLPATLARITNAIENPKPKGPPKPKSVAPNAARQRNAPNATRTATTRKKKLCDGDDAEDGPKCLNRLRREGLIYGVIKGLNILYDTTLTARSDKIKEDIMPILEMNKEIKYKVVVILVKAPIQMIARRLEKRHREMLEEVDPYIRAVSPKLLSMFVADNEKGFDNAKKYFKAGTWEVDNPDTLYSASDFSFKEIENLDIKVKAN